MLCLKGQYAPQSNFLLIAETMCCVCHLCYDMFVLWRNEQVLDYLLNGAHGDRRYDPPHNCKKVEFYNTGMI